MTQIINGNLPVDTNIDNIIAALATCNKGATSPTYAQAGMLWVDDSVEPQILKLYDGSDWIEIGDIDTVNNTFKASSAHLDIATTSEALNGTNDEKVMTPLKVKEALQAQSSSGLVDVKTFNASGTYTKSSQASKIVVYLYGAGGGGGAHLGSSTAGSQSKFGNHLTANGGSAGGQAGTSFDGASVGSAVGGDVNLAGAGSLGGAGAVRYEGSGRGNVGGQGAAGGFCFKVFSADALSQNTAVTIGSGGDGGSASTSWKGANGVDGLCLVFEYS